jgi:hypothetical protein
LAARHSYDRRPRQVLAAVPAAAQITHHHLIGVFNQRHRRPRRTGLLTGRRPDEVREERRTGLRYGESNDGGRLEVDESAPSCRSNSAIRRSAKAI